MANFVLNAAPVRVAPQAQGSGLNTASTERPKKLVVIVDDSPLVAARVRAVLGRYGVEVKEFRRAEDLLAARRQAAAADLIILDRLLPGLDGLAALEQVRKTPELARTPVMMLTVSAEKAYVQRAAELGVADYLLKPFKDETLVERVERVIGPLKPEAPTPGPARPEILTEIRKEIKRARRGQTPFFLLGIQPGGAIPQEQRESICRALAGALRETDTVIAGPDRNFILLLPFADRMGAEKVSEKVKGVLEHSGVEGTAFAVTVFPEGGEDEEALFTAMEKRLAELQVEAGKSGDPGADGRGNHSVVRQE
ncbi:MAG: response regulator [Desulfotomaculales bacterium]